MKNSRLRLEAARTHLRAGRLEEAMRLYEAVLQDNPEVSAAYIGIGTILLRQGHLADAEDYFHGALHVARDPAPALLKLAVLAERMQNVTRAVELNRRAVEQNPGLFRARASLCRLYLQSDQADSAERLLRESLRQEPASLPIKLLLAKVLQRQGKLGEAIALTEGLERDERAPPSAYVMRARLLGRIGLWSDAAALLMACNERTAGGERLQRYLGRALLHSGRWHEARRILETASVNGTLSIESTVDLARCQALAGDLDRAHSRLIQLGKARGGVYQAYFLLGEVTAAQALFREAVIQFDAGALNAPRHFAERAGIIEILHGRQERKAKVHAYLRVLDQVSDQGSAYHSLEYFRRAQRRFCEHTN
jgi:tetratricopeptide (TPR) repeat protein